MYTFDNDTLNLEIEFDVTAAHADFAGRLRVSSLVDFFIQAAVVSADELKLGLTDVHRQQSFWVLSRLKVVLLKKAVWYDKIRVITWPKDTQGLFYLRDFLAYDQHGELVAKATSMWVALDLKTKRPRLVSHGVQEQLAQNKDRHGLNEIPQKLTTFSSPPQLTKKACYSDLDFNNHVTSCRYIEWIMDTLPFDVIRDNYPTSMTINYLRETQIGNTIELSLAVEGDSYAVDAINTSIKAPAFRGLVTF